MPEACPFGSEQQIRGKRASSLRVTPGKLFAPCWAKATQEQCRRERNYIRVTSDKKQVLQSGARNLWWLLPSHIMSAQAQSQ